MSNWAAVDPVSIVWSRAETLTILRLCWSDLRLAFPASCVVRNGVSSGLGDYDSEGRLILRLYTESPWRKIPFTDASF